MTSSMGSGTNTTAEQDPPPFLPKEGALRAYVSTPDPHYAYEPESTFRADGATCLHIQMTSQKWRDSADVNLPIWRHTLTLIVPDKVESKLAYLWIEGGNAKPPDPRQVSAKLLSLAVNTRAVVIRLSDVPNQPLLFRGDSAPRTENAAVAATFERFLQSKEWDWPVFLPMVKSVIRAMDTCQAVLNNDRRFGAEVESFVLSGGSKRGVVAWLASAVDPRVAAFIPIVIDWVNVPAQMIHLRNVYGAYPELWADFSQFDFLNGSPTSDIQTLLEIVDPIHYFDSLTMPKLVLTAAGCQFFPPDSPQYYFPALPRQKLLRCVPNCDHKLQNSDALQTIAGFFRSLVTDTPLPEIEWVSPECGTLEVAASRRPLEARFWYAHAPCDRDFRLATLGPLWQVLPMEPTGVGHRVAYRLQSSRGWFGFFAEFLYDTGLDAPCKFTTEIMVLPAAAAPVVEVRARWDESSSNLPSPSLRRPPGA